MKDCQRCGSTAMALGFWEFWNQLLVSLLIESTKSKCLSRLVAFLPLSWISQGPCWNFPTVSSRVLDLTNPPNSLVSWSVYERLFSTDAPFIWRWRKQRVATAPQFHRLRLCSELILGTQWAESRQIREDLDVAPSKVSFHSSHLG